ncbi:unnamed protein product, partial [Cladocopium goreaui]
EDECGPELLKLIAALDEVEKPEFRAIVEEAIGQLEVEEQKAKEKAAESEKRKRKEPEPSKPPEPEPIPEDQDMPGSSRPHVGVPAPNR